MEEVVRLAVDGLNVKQIAKETELPLPYVRALIRKADLNIKVEDTLDEIKAKIIQDKVPILKEIAAYTLNAVMEFVQDGLSGRITSIKDAKDLINMVSTLNEMARLDEGKSTSNVAVAGRIEVDSNIDRTRELLDVLKKVDPIFTYPEIPDAQSEPIREFDEACRTSNPLLQKD